jgi:hypothetical protein
VQVDLMGSSVLGLNTLLFLVDGLWGGTEATEFPVKWTMEPFNNDWPNSIFVSQDQVALESVCFDFLRNEAEVGSDLWKDRPNFAQGVDDYLHQAADSDNWPEGIEYDPDDSGTPIGSLGIHEHWNNPTQKQYKKNMGSDYGIELYAIPSDLVDDEVGVFERLNADYSEKVRTYPNPVSDMLTFEMELSGSSEVEINLLDLSGRQVSQVYRGDEFAGTFSRNFDIQSLDAGIYVYQVYVRNRFGTGVSSGKIQVVR